MTWISCGFCHQAPCRCQQPVVPFQTWTGTTTFPVQTFFGPPRLSEEDVDRIAKRVADLLTASGFGRVTRSTVAPVVIEEDEP